MRRYLKSRAQLGKTLQHLKPLARLGRQSAFRCNDEVAERTLFRAADAPAQLIELC